MDLEQEFKKETGYDAYIDNNLEPKIPMGYYVEWLEERIEQLRLGVVSQQRELFYNFITWYNAIPKVKKPENGLITTNIIDKYLKL